MPHRFHSVGDAFRAAPATLLFLLASVAGFALIQFDAPVTWVALFTFTDFQIQAEHLVFFPVEGQYWRWLSPIFLHFGWLHIVFNGLWLWEFGVLIERRFGSLCLCLLITACGAASNWAQYLWEGPALFGGMSGVIYALLAYCWIINRLIPNSGLALPPGIAFLLMAWLLICMSGLLDLLAGINIANAAHLGGLLSGTLGAIGTVIWRGRRRGKRGLLG